MAVLINIPSWNNFTSLTSDCNGEEKNRKIKKIKKTKAHRGVRGAGRLGEMCLLMDAQMYGQKRSKQRNWETTLSSHVLHLGSL